MCRECFVYVYVFAVCALQYYVILLHFRAHINSDVLGHSSQLNQFVYLSVINFASWLNFSS